MIKYKMGIITIEGREETTKNDGSYRDIVMSSMARDALEKQFKVSGKGTYVFSK